MTRREFVRICGILGIGSPISSSLISCKDQNEISPFGGKVIIIGAGAGGLSAAYLLQQLGIAYEILEASSRFGGRMKINSSFADFPIPLGAEWLEGSTNVFQEIVNDPTVKVDIQTVEDTPDRKFINYSWYSFFEEYIVPSIAENITYNNPVHSIDYTGEKVVVSAQKGTVIGDKVIVCVPIKILKDKDIDFIPGLPQSKLSAVNEVEIWDGFKAFFEFSNKFYKDEYEFEIEPKADGEKIYYNASFGQNTSKNILGLFVVGKHVEEYSSLTEDNLKEHILRELDNIYAKQATPNYLNHVSQNWQKEPFIKSGYLSDYADWKTVRELGKPLADKIYFAGGEYTDGEDWVSVHLAAQSARSAVAALND